MPNLARRLRRQKNAMHRRWREFTMIVRGVVSTDHPVQAHIVPIRRCNLACTYCNEYDDFSKPVATSEMLDRVDNLARLGTTLIVITHSPRTLARLEPDVVVVEGGTAHRRERRAA